MDLTSIPVDFVLKAAKSVKKLAYLIAIIGAITSFGTQVGLLESWGMSTAFAVGIAATVDLLAICAAIALQVPGFPDKGLVGTIMVFALSVSITANIIAGLKESAGAAAGHAWPVIAYMLAEFIANRLRTYVARILEAQAKKEEAKVVHATATVSQAPVPPVVPAAPAPKPLTAAPIAKPGSGKSKILALAAVIPPMSPDAIAAQVGVKPGWVKHVIKTSTP